MQLDTCAGSEAGVKARGIDRAARWDVEGVEWREELGWGHRLADGVGVAGKALRYRVDARATQAEIKQCERRMQIIKSWDGREREALKGLPPPGWCASCRTPP